MKTLPHDARSFVHGVVEYLRKEGKAPTSLPRVKTLFRKVTSQARMQNQAWVESAVLLTPSEKSTLQRVLSGQVGHALSCTFAVRKDLVAGMRIRVADWLVDTSLLGQLTAMQEELLQS